MPKEEITSPPRAWRAPRVVWLLLGAFMLSACETTINTRAEVEAGVARAEWVMVPPDTAWVNTPGATLVLERQFAEVREQRISLPNDTTLAGDNFIHLRAVAPSHGHIFELDRALQQAGGLPAPFAEEDLDVMRSREDSAGTLTWTEWTNGAGTDCVMALRRVPAGVRLLPGRATALDLVMRNCVSGGVDAALAPAGPAAVAFPAPHGSDRGAEVLTLSPLAAPMP
jgi:hypothetical protein